MRLSSCKGVMKLSFITTAAWEDLLCIIDDFILSAMMSILDKLLIWYPKRAIPSDCKLSYIQVDFIWLHSHTLLSSLRRLIESDQKQ